LCKAITEPIKRFFYERRIEIEKIESQRGVDGKFKGYYVTKKTCKNPGIEKWLLDSTVILGWNENGRKGSASGEWTFKIDKKILKNLKSIELKIKSIRAHAGLHIPAMYAQQGFDGEGSVYINNEPIDAHIVLERKMPHGKDLGMHEVGPYPIMNWIDKNREKYIIRLEVNDYTLWDIDEISLEPIVERWRAKTMWTLIAGAILSGIIGWFFLKFEGIMKDFIDSLYLCFKTIISFGT